MNGPGIPGNPENIGCINEPDSKDYQMLYETPVDGIFSSEVLIKSSPDPTHSSDHDSQKKSQALDYEEPRDSCSVDKHYTALNADTISSPLYETPINPANTDYDTPWKKLF